MWRHYNACCKAIYVVGGYAGNEPLGDVECFDPAVGAYVMVQSNERNRTMTKILVPQWVQ